MKNEAMFTTGNNEWGTPPELFRLLDEEFRFTIDAAASKDNALISRYWTEEDDALSQSWKHERVFCNPPYGREYPAFVRKAAEREAEVAVLLIAARTDTAVWHDCILGKSEVRFIRGRLKFTGGKYHAPFASAIIIFRPVSFSLYLHQDET